MADRFLVVHFTDKLDPGVRFSEWPQHLTILPWMNGDIEATTKELGLVTDSFEPIEYTVENEARFGPHHDIPVWTVGPQDVLKGLHLALLDGLKSAKLEDDRFAGEAYRPHISQKGHHQLLHANQMLLLADVAVVQKGPRHKLIHSRLMLGKWAVEV